MRMADELLEAAQEDNDIELAGRLESIRDDLHKLIGDDQTWHRIKEETGRFDRARADLDRTRRELNSAAEKLHSAAIWNVQDLRLTVGVAILSAVLATMLTLYVVRENRYSFLTDAEIQNMYDGRLIQKKLKNMDEDDREIVLEKFRNSSTLEDVLSTPRPGNR